MLLLHSPYCGEYIAKILADISEIVDAIENTENSKKLIQMVRRWPTALTNRTSTVMHICAASTVVEEEGRTPQSC